MNEETIRSHKESDVEKKIEKELAKAREEYYQKHGRYPEEDGMTIHINK